MPPSPKKQHDQPRRKEETTQLEPSFSASAETPAARGSPAAPAAGPGAGSRSPPGSAPWSAVRSLGALGKRTWLAEADADVVYMSHRRPFRGNGRVSLVEDETLAALDSPAKSFSLFLRSLNPPPLYPPPRCFGPNRWEASRKPCGSFRKP